MAVNYPFPIDPQYTAIAIAYQNRSLIGSQVLPMTPVASKRFNWIRHTLSEGFTPPADYVGRKSKPNQISFTGTEETNTTADYALDDPIPRDDIEASNIPGFDLQGRSTEYLTNLLELAHEKRIADKVFNPDTYPAANKDILSGTSQFNDPTSNPIEYLLEKLDGLVMRPNVLVFGQDSWRQTRQNPNVVEYVKGTGIATGGQRGMISREQFAEALEVEQILVGQGWINSAVRGQTPALNRVWGKHISMIYRDVLAGPQRGTTFGMCAMFGNKIAGTIEDPDVGMRGGIRVRAGWSVADIITAPDLGYFIEDAVA